ncbi:sensor histidine kinase [Streptomyces sp. NBC_01789]|uniref:sensor histidine kinase n=1 Tax=Streptomyces sp. NBC_01789 TaxID=2975941 RepID=UPI002252DC24|nr:histidine kinase [Streptomyces sp. NBC_01789]MCX4449845.1 histidine kinase [Streptomyces sp. NBC_01789]
MTPLIGRLVDRRARLRWLHLIIGGALLMPYYLVGTVVVGLYAPDTNPFTSLPAQFAAFAHALPMAAVTALLPLARPLSVSAARALCGLAPDRPLADGPGVSRQARARSAAWFTLHVGLGGVISGMTLALVPFAFCVMGLPFFAALRDSPALERSPLLDHTWVLALAPPAGAAMLLALAGCAAAAGALLANRAPVLLGPAPDDRLAAAERRAAELAVRNRLARELHDSVGHALSAVTLQAGAARRVLDSDPEFARQALTAIEETTRRTVGELDAVLGLLRQGADGSDGLAGPGLDALGGLLARCGVPVRYATDGDPGTVPGPVSAEAYRIVQEGLSNALRHGVPGSPVRLRVGVGPRELTLVLDSALSPRPPAARPGGGRGLTGIAERALLLGGATEAGPRDDGVWRLAARLPLHAPAKEPR